MLTAFRHPPLRAGQIDRPHQFWRGGDMLLESGEVLRELELCYVTHGALDGARDNAVLVAASLSGNHHRLDFLIGPGRALDTGRYFVVCVDPLGNGLSSSPSNSVAQPGARFPRFALRDMVNAQHRLLTEAFGITRLRAVVGASMGGMQALQWGVSHPGFVDRLVALTAMARTAPWAAAVLDSARHALMADPAWNGSEFVSVPGRGWRAWTSIMAVLAVRTPQALAEMFASPLEVGPWIDTLAADVRSGGFDALDWLYQSEAYLAHDVGTTPGMDGDCQRALRSIQASVLLLSPTLDLFNPGECAAEAAPHIPHCEWITIPSAQGHQCVSTAKAADAEFLDQAIGAFLSS